VLRLLKPAFITKIRYGELNNFRGIASPFTKSEADAPATPFMHMTLHVWDIATMVAIPWNQFCKFLEISLSWYCSII
jgi:hypothetical protein